MNRGVIIGAVAVGTAIAVPMVLGDSALLDVTAAVLWITVVVALAFAFHTCGIPSLAQGAFVGLGAYGAAVAQSRWGFDPIAAIAFVAVAGFVPAIVSGLAIARLRPTFAALATWLLGWCFVLAVGAFPGVSGGSRGIVLPRAVVDVHALGDPFVVGAPFWWAAALVFAAIVLGVYASGRWRYGPALQLVRADAPAAAAMGLRVDALRTGAMAASSWVAIVAGSLLAQVYGIADPTQYRIDLSYRLLLAVIIGGSAPVIGPVVGIGIVAGSHSLAGALLPPSATQYTPIAVAATLLVLIVVAPTGLDLRRFFARRRPTGTAGGPAPPDPLGPGQGADVEVDGVTLVIEGNTLLRDVSVAVESGTCLAIVGPNGSGKTMLARVLAGTCRPSRGHVVIERRPPDHDRAAAHVSRTLQRTIAAPTLPTATLVRAAAEPTRATGWLQALTATPLARSEQRDVERRVSSILAWCGIPSVADRPIGTLDATEQRLTQLASALVSRPSVMILDEPTSGLDVDGTHRVTERIDALHSTGVTVIVIEHDLAVVRSVTDQYAVLLDGQIRAHGDSDTIDNDPVVRAFSGGPVSW